MSERLVIDYDPALLSGSKSKTYRDDRIKEVILTNKIRAIPAFMFMNIDLKEVDIPNSVNFIGYKAFGLWDGGELLKEVLGYTEDLTNIMNVKNSGLILLNKNKSNEKDSK